MQNCNKVVIPFLKNKLSVLRLSGVVYGMHQIYPIIMPFKLSVFPLSIYLFTNALSLSVSLSLSPSPSLSLSRQFSIVQLIYLLKLKSKPKIIFFF